MGNLCGKPASAAAGPYVQQQQQQQQQQSDQGQQHVAAKGEVPSTDPQQQAVNNSPPLQQQQQQPQPQPQVEEVPVDTLKAAAHGKPRSFSAPRDPIAETLHAAHLELKTNGTRNFEDFYKLDKIIGHGAFAKVSICTSLATQQQYAVKAVQKNKEDLTGKQREGRSSILRRQGEKCRGSDFDFRHSSDILPTPPLSHTFAHAHTLAPTFTHANIHSRKQKHAHACAHMHTLHTQAQTPSCTQPSRTCMKHAQ